MIASGAAVTLSDVPAYSWYHGCGPTAAGSVIGYYDLQGYDGLYDVSGWSDVKLTNNVKHHISSPEHNAKYDPTPDNAGLPVPENTSLACWFRTSVDPLQYGWSYLSRADDSFEGFADYRGYVCESSYEYFGTQDYRFNWGDLVAEIDAGRPMMFLIDTDGNGGTDHFVPVFGYDDRGSGDLYYACYTTWSESESVTWKRFRAMGSSWGVGYGIYVDLSARDGDLDQDGRIDADDIDLLCDNIGGDPALYDMDSDGDVDADDMVYLVETLVEYDLDGDDVADGQGTFCADFNLDGAVDLADLTVLRTNAGLSGMGFADGNANIDDIIDLADLTILQTLSGSSVSGIPEPAAVGLLSLGAVGLLRRRRLHR